MGREKLDKKIPSLEPFFESILVCNNRDRRPFIEIFISEPENFSQQRLGTLFGIFEVADESEDSSYIVNYLISVIRKEYFSKPKSGAVESLESALHKANVALSKLAANGSVSWIGRINAIVATIEKNNLHLSQTGTTSAFLLRSKMLTDISEGLSPKDQEINPVKTFINVSSGRLEEGDKIIVATENIFDIFSFEEIKRSALGFKGPDFVQFLRTALGNELEKSGVLVVDVKEKKEAPAPIPQKQELNAFSQAAFARNNRPKSKPAEELEEAVEEEIIQEKSGHLYIKGAEETEPGKRFDFQEFIVLLKDKIEPVGKATQKLVWKIKDVRLPLSKFKLPKKSEPTKNEPAENYYQQQTGKTFDYSESQFKEIPEKQPSVFSGKTKKYLSAFYPAIKRGLYSFSKILPSFIKIKERFLSLDYRQRIIAVAICCFIIIAPLFFLRFGGQEEVKVETPVPEVKIVIPLEQDKNVIRLENLNEIYLGEKINRVVNLKDKFYTVMESAVVDLETQSKFDIPSEIGKPEIICSMDDLNLIFLINKNDRKISSWSPVSKKFQSNNIVFPEGADIIAADTYLTYLYLVDGKDSQIYRYPRAEGGFGAANKWKKDATDISGTSGIAINENLFLSNENIILKFFRGAKQDFMVEETATPIAPFKLWTKRDNESLYVLDHDNARIIKLDKDGKIITQYYHPEIGEAIDFTVNELTGSIYFSSPESVKSFNMQ